MNVIQSFVYWQHPPSRSLARIQISPDLMETPAGLHLRSQGLMETCDESLSAFPRPDYTPEPIWTFPARREAAKFMCVKEINFSVLSSRDVIVSGPTHPRLALLPQHTHTHTHTSPSSGKSNLGFEKDLLSQGSDVYCPKVCDFLSHYFSDV